MRDGCLGRRSRRKELALRHQATKKVRSTLQPGTTSSCLSVLVREPLLLRAPCATCVSAIPFSYSARFCHRRRMPVPPNAIDSRPAGELQRSSRAGARGATHGQREHWDHSQLPPVQFARKATIPARKRHFQSDVSALQGDTFADQSDTSARKVTLFGVKLTESSRFPSGHCHTRQHLRGTPARRPFPNCRRIAKNTP